VTPARLGPVPRCWFPKRLSALFGTSVKRLARARRGASIWNPYVGRDGGARVWARNRALAPWHGRQRLRIYYSETGKSPARARAWAGPQEPYALDGETPPGRRRLPARVPMRQFCAHCKNLPENACLAGLGTNAPTRPGLHAAQAITGGDARALPLEQYHIPEAPRARSLGEEICPCRPGPRCQPELAGRHDAPRISAGRLRLPSTSITWRRLAHLAKVVPRHFVRSVLRRGDAWAMRPSRRFLKTNNPEALCRDAGPVCGPGCGGSVD